ncbi:MAG: metallophosphoesterase family protein [Chloroflexota bacterium]
MKLGLIADIHADFDALTLALDLLQKEGVDQIVCAGDVVGKGPKGQAVVQLLETKEIPCIAGNHDRKMLRRATADEQTLTFLKQLPATRSFTWEGRRVLVAHGLPWSDELGLFPFSERHVFKRVAHEAHADVVILGHTHLPLMAQIDNVWICNPGSVCSTYKIGSHSCATLTLPDCTYRALNLGSGRSLWVRAIRFRR